VLVVSLVALVAVAALTGLRYRGRVLAAARQEALRQRLEQQRAARLAAATAQAKTDQALRQVHIPPLILHPDSSLHLGSPHGGAAGLPGAAEGAAAWGGRHGCTMLVQGSERAFSSVILWRASSEAAGSDGKQLAAAARGEVAGAVDATSAAGNAATSAAAASAVAAAACSQQQQHAEERQAEGQAAGNAQQAG
jgi:hypothetical protein